jgi:hypothetical protein
MIDPVTIRSRLDQLRAEAEAGERALRELDARRDQLVAGLMRLSGATQALEQVLAGASDQTGAPATDPRAETAHPG